MKKIFFTLFVCAIVLPLIIPVQTFAQTAKDTLVLYANPLGSTIDEQIMADTVGGRDPNRVYVLQQTGAIDTAYFVNSIITFNFNLTIIGKPNPVTGMLPVIAPGYSASGASPGRLFHSTGGNLTLKNLYITDKNLKGAVTTTGFGTIYITGDSVTTVVDHCVMDGAGKANFVYAKANDDKLIVSNCELRNFQYASPYRAGLVYLGKPNYVYDTVSVTNSTLFCVNGGDIGMAGTSKFVNFDHNTLFFVENVMGGSVMNAVIKNNIFYALNYVGADTSSYLNQTYEGSFTGNQAFKFDSLSATVKSEGYTEAERNITIENNVYYWPKQLMTLIASLKDDTGGVIVPPVWMNKLVTKMFTDKTTWPNLVAKNNMEVDPGFNQSYISQILDTLKLFAVDYWDNGGSSTHLWGLYMDDPLDIYLLPGHQVPSNWAKTQGYPVPENLKYSNTALYTVGTDGKPLGDLNWFLNITGVKQVSNNIPTKFQLSQNYPNPFNPSTNIEYSLPKSSFVSLKVYNILGQEVATLYKGFQKAGNYKVNFNASKLASGVYLYRLQSNDITMTKKMILMK